MIRQATATDIDGVEEGYRDHFLYEKKHVAYTVFKEGAYPTRKDAARALLNKALYVYVDQGAVAGSIISDGRQPDEYGEISWPSQAAPEQVAVIHLLMVNPRMAGKGIGSALVNHAIKVAEQRSCAAIRLDTGAQNIPAVSLYKKMGFRVVATSTMKVGGVIPHTAHLFLEKSL